MRIVNDPEYVDVLIHCYATIPVMVEDKEDIRQTIIDAINQAHLNGLNPEIQVAFVETFDEFGNEREYYTFNKQYLDKAKVNVDGHVIPLDQPTLLILNDRGLYERA